MDFGFNDDQVSFRDAVNGYLTDSFTPVQLRQVWAQPDRYDHWVWRKGLAQLGVPGVLVADEHGGSGGTPVDLMLVLEELGAAAVPEPVAETAVVAPLLLAEFGDAETRERWLAPLAAGDLLVAWAATPKDALVAYGVDADLVIVRDGEDVHLVPASSVSGEIVQGADPSRRLAACDVEIGATTLLTSDPAAGRLIDAAGATATGALLVGLSQRLIDLTRDYLLARRQFGKTLGEFQSLKHRLADVAVQTEAARSLVWHAGYRLTAGEVERAPAARMAKAAASRAAYLAGSAALQLHGGIGFTWEHDLHMFLQRGKAWERAYGDTGEHRLELGTQILELA